MTTIFEDKEMDFINWDAAGAETGFDLQSPQDAPSHSVNDETNMDLVLQDVEGDDWSFWALQHYESTQIPQDLVMSTIGADEPLVQPDALLSQMSWETPEAPCRHCALGNYDCKRIQEGKYKGYCTSCVALRCECSFGPVGNHAGSEAGETFPANPWPIMGDRPETSILHEDELAAATNRTLATSELPPLADADVNYTAPPQPVAKVGARFSRESVRILKNWVSTHNRHPYPTEEEKEGLQKITGLSKVQITNWLANARRRGKIQPTRSTSPHVGRGYIQAIDIPQRRGTPRATEHMNPLQRWANSPPENEPASVTAIARAVTASSSSEFSSNSEFNSPYVSGYSDDGSSKSLCNQSSASSFSNSHGSSGGSFASSFSHQSRGSLGSLPSFVRSNRGRRRRRRAAPPTRANEALTQPLKTYECTFCTETFRTKHDWQRHEKSLHLSLERWVCSPNGGKATNPENVQMSCVYCGEANPDEAHIESHNLSGCTERSLEERTFYRKDHLRQHLKLVHHVKFLPWSMDQWRVASPQIRSRCGFCGIVMDSWSIRVDHLAEHFKTGNTMADWKGDWGFDAPVLDMVENSIPPYLIHDERNTPLPYMASAGHPSSPTNAYELLKYELQYWAHNKLEDTGKPPTDEETQQEACRIIFGSEALSRNPLLLAPSWLRDLVVSNENATRTAMYLPIRKQSENRSTNLVIKGKDNIFETCEMESQLQDFVKARQLLGLTATDQELQIEACRIIGRMEEKSPSPSEDVANWLLRLIHTSAQWLADFRKRAHLPRSEDIVDINKRSQDLTSIDSTIHNYSRLEHELGDFLRTQRLMGLEPTDDDLQRQARCIIYDHDDNWNQTAADDAEWLASFKERHRALAEAGSVPVTLDSSPKDRGQVTIQSQTTYLAPKSTSSGSSALTPPSRSVRPGPYFLNDANCFRRLAKDLTRFVASTMSANNPNCHIPTDEEIQHQARWIVYDDDDPWNQTAADNAEWMQRFKRDVGIIPRESGPGLAAEDLQWTASKGGTGFAPPFVMVNPQATLELLTENPKVFCRDSSRTFEPDAATVNRYLRSLPQRYPAPAKVFCSRELENGLTEYVKREMSKSGKMPTDNQLRERAKDIMSMQKTAADDPVLLEKFKDIMQQMGIAPPSAPAMGMITPAIAAPTSTVASASSAMPELSAPYIAPDLLNVLPSGADMSLTDEQVSNILRDMDTSF